MGARPTETANVSPTRTRLCRHFSKREAPICETAVPLPVCPFASNLSEASSRTEPRSYVKPSKSIPTRNRQSCATVMHPKSYNPEKRKTATTQPSCGTRPWNNYRPETHLSSQDSHNSHNSHKSEHPFKNTYRKYPAKTRLPRALLSVFFAAPIRMPG
jgi:hypothetical protein